MSQMIISFVVALVVAFAVYAETSSYGLAFLAYSGAGVLVMFTALLATGFGRAPAAKDINRTNAAFKA